MHHKWTNKERLDGKTASIKKMACRHRFFNSLIPQQTGLEFLLIGTFNPCWNVLGPNDRDHFYGRSTNLFWCICPHAFNDRCLIDESLAEWNAFLDRHRIGLTDIICEVSNANEDNPVHLELLIQGFEDKNLDKRSNGGYIFDLQFNTQVIKEFITYRKNELKGVFFTRKTAVDIPRIWEQWLDVKLHCDSLYVNNGALPTPSVRGGGVRDKIAVWCDEIKNCL